MGKDSKVWRVERRRNREVERESRLCPLWAKRVVGKVWSREVVSPNPGKKQHGEWSVCSYSGTGTFMPPAPRALSGRDSGPPAPNSFPCSNPHGWARAKANCSGNMEGLSPSQLRPACNGWFWRHGGGREPKIHSERHMQICSVYCVRKSDVFWEQMRGTRDGFTGRRRRFEAPPHLPI